ncbi:type IV pilin [Halosimplex carlsbadense]|nr:type IV pilin [Halosimplex carlsbadense]
MDGDTMLNLVGAAIVVAVAVGLVVVGLNIAGGSGNTEAPDVNWTVERVDDTAVRITHAGGDPVRTDDLTVRVESYRRATDWADPVTESDSTVVQASEGSTVRIVWSPGRGDDVIMHSERV